MLPGLRFLHEMAISLSLSAEPWGEENPLAGRVCQIVLQLKFATPPTRLNTRKIYVWRWKQNGISDMGRGQSYLSRVKYAQRIWAIGSQIELNQWAERHLAKSAAIRNLKFLGKRHHISPIARWRSHMSCLVLLGRSLQYL